MKTLLLTFCPLLLSVLSMRSQNMPVQLIEGGISDRRKEETVATSEDGQMVLVYTDEGGVANLYVNRLIGNGWTKAERVSKAVRADEGYSSEFISAEGNAVYFSGNRPGGFGGTDIYMYKKLPGGGWSEAINLGAGVNSPFDEEAPFVYPDGRTIYFTSNREKEHCCFDIFRSTLLNDGSWAEPYIVGYPAKTFSDEVMYVDSAGSSLPLSSPVIEQKDEHKGVYLVTFVDQKKIPLIMIKGKVLDAKGKVLPLVKASVTDNESGDTYEVFNINSASADYILPLPPARNLNLTYEAEGYLFQSENVDLHLSTNQYKTQKAIRMPMLKPGAMVILNNVYFDDGTANLRDISTVELERVFRLLSENRSMVVELSYYNEERKISKSDKVIALSRAQALANYLENKGIEKDRLIVVESKRDKESVLKDPAKSNDKKNPEADKTIRQGLELKVISVKSSK